MTQNIPRDMTQNVPRDMTQNIPRDMMQNIPRASVVNIFTVITAISPGVPPYWVTLHRVHTSLRKPSLRL